MVLAGQHGQVPAAGAGEQPVVADCRSAYGVLAHEAVRVPRHHCRPARRLTDGTLKWRLAGLPVQTASA